MAQSSQEEKKEEKKEEHNEKESVVYTWGTGRNGEIGHDNLDKSQNCLLPSPVTFFSKKSIKIVSIACGEGFSCAISSNGELFTWGLKYKLGVGELKENQKKPILVDYFVKNKLLIDKVACGECHMGVITKNHKLFLWGKSENGCIGDGNQAKHNVLLPFQLCITNKNKNDDIYPIDLDLGWKTSAVITNNGCVYSWGCSSNKTLGHKDITKNYLKPTKVDFNLNDDDIKIIKISVGSHHSGAVTNHGDVFMWGNNLWYNLGLGNNKNKSIYCTPQWLAKDKYFNNESIINISCTKSMLTPVKGPGKEGLHTMCVSSNGHLFCFGSGHKGKCANLTEKWGFHLKGDEDIKKPYYVGGKAYDDKNNKKNTNYFKNVNITQCVGSAIHSAVLDDNGKIYTFGCGSDGRMGLKAYVEGSCGAGKQVYKFYVSKPTVVEVLDEKNIIVKQIGSGRRHMIVLGYKTKK